MRLKDILEGATLAEYEQAEDVGVLARLREDLTLLDAHLRMKLAGVVAGEVGAPGWSKLRQLRQAVIDSRATGDPKAATHALGKLLQAVDQGGEDAAAWGEVQALIERRLQLALKERALQSAHIAGSQTHIAKEDRFGLIRELALFGYSRVQITRMTGVPPRTVTRYLAKLREMGRKQRYDVKDVIAELRARFAHRRQWLYAQRAGATSVQSITRLAAEETKMDQAEMELLRTVGILTVMASSLVDRGTLDRARGLSTDAVSAELAERARVYLERRTGAETKPIDG